MGKILEYPVDASRQDVNQLQSQCVVILKKTQFKNIRYLKAMLGYEKDKFYGPFSHILKNNKDMRFGINMGTSSQSCLKVLFSLKCKLL